MTKSIRFFLLFLAAMSFPAVSHAEDAETLVCVGSLFQARIVAQMSEIEAALQSGDLISQDKGENELVRYFQHKGAYGHMRQSIDECEKLHPAIQSKDTLYGLLRDAVEMDRKFAKDCASSSRQCEIFRIEIENAVVRELSPLYE